MRDSKMLYIHDLNHLNVKTAEIESVYLMRDIRQKCPFPFKAEQLGACFSQFLPSPNEIELMCSTLLQVEPAAEKVIELFKRNDPDYEPIDLQRAITMLKSIPGPLELNIKFAEELMDWQDRFAEEITPVLNSIPGLRMDEEKAACNSALNEAFMHLLRNKEFGFSSAGIIGEAEKSTMESLSEMMAKGRFFHVTVEEELQKKEFSDIKRRISPTKLAEVEQLSEDIDQIKEAAEAAYDLNMRAINWALVLYAFVKLAKESLI